MTADQALAWGALLATLGSGLVAGTFFAFSGFVMAALGHLGAKDAAAAMQVINRVILSSAFMPVFFGTGLLAAALSVLALLAPNAAGRTAVLAAGLLYLLGVIAVTVVANVPMNDRLAAEGAAFWPGYARRWTGWNHLRTAAALAAAALYAIAAAA
jgi:uncharacterized membrane protein